MTLESPLWLQNLPSPYYPASADRRLITAIWSPGVLAPTGLRVSQRTAGANISVDVASGSCVVAGSAASGQGSYLCASTAVENVALAAVPASGQKRIDLIVATVADSSVVGADDEWTIAAVTGTPTTGTPAAPTVPASSLALAEVLVVGGAATVTDAQITDRRVLSGTPTDAGSTTVAPSFEGQLMAQTGIVYVAQSGAWLAVNAAPPPRPKFYQATAASWTVSSGATDQTVMSVSVPAPGWPARISAWAQGETGVTVSAAGDHWLDHKIMIGATAGAAQRVGRTASGSMLDTRLVTVPFAPSASAAISGLTSTTVRVSAAASALTWGCSGGQLLVRVDPIDT